jgi:hypothetical protein
MRRTRSFPLLEFNGHLIIVFKNHSNREEKSSTRIIVSNKHVNFKAHTHVTRRSKNLPTTTRVTRPHHKVKCAFSAEIPASRSFTHYSFRITPTTRHEKRRRHPQKQQMPFQSSIIPLSVGSLAWHYCVHYEIVRCLFSILINLAKYHNK